MDENKSTRKPFNTRVYMFAQYIDFATRGLPCLRKVTGSKNGNFEQEGKLLTAYSFTSHGFHQIIVNRNQRVSFRYGQVV